MERANMTEYFGRQIGPDEVNWVMIELALRSAAFLAIIPVQDVLGAGPEARMNKPSTVKGNWSWRFLPGVLSPDVAARLAALTAATGR
jgi:4-alpha-glucanotransferase